MSLSRADVEKVSLLARLRLSEAELETMTAQLGQIVAYVDQLAELDTKDVAPMAHAVEMHNVFREDEVADSLTRQQALANAPKHDNECFLVPAVLG
jgi:aspartyl-tRNA(Asn)/glutamyl-tRNA(Gln) amidotransferase subunit C